MKKMIGSRFLFCKLSGVFQQKIFILFLLSLTFSGVLFTNVSYADGLCGGGTMTLGSTAIDHYENCRAIVGNGCECTTAVLKQSYQCTGASGTWTGWYLRANNRPAGFKFYLALGDACGEIVRP